MDVPELVQEEGFVEPLCLVQKDRSPERHPRHMTGSERPAADAQRKPANAKARFAKLGKLLRQFPW